MLKRLLFLLILTFSLFSSAIPSNEVLLEIFNALEVPLQDTSLKGLADAAQENWRQSGERWDFEERYNGKEIVPLLKKTGCFETKYAKDNHYKYGLVLGATLPSVRKRIDFLIKEWNRGVRFEKIVFLTGQRPLNEKLESSKEFLHGTLPKNETEVMLFVWNEVDLPKELKALPLEVIDAPPIPPLERPTTQSTIEAFLKTQPTEGKCLAFSNQPYIGPQHATLKHFLPRSLPIETVGPLGGESLPASILLDNLARWLYWACRETK